MYSYNKSSEAYDISRYDSAEEVKRQPKPKQQNIQVHKTAAARNGSWLKTMLFVTVLVVLALAFVNEKALISEYSVQIGDSTATLDEAKRENARLKAELDGIVTLGRVEEVAVSSLGLQKTAKTQIKYITVYDRTMVQSSASDLNVFERLENWFDNTSEYLGF